MNLKYVFLRYQYNIISRGGTSGRFGESVLLLKRLSILLFGIRRKSRTRYYNKLETVEIYIKILYNINRLKFIKERLFNEIY